MTRLVPLLALLTADTFAALGSAMTVIAIPWFVLATTGSGSQTGLVAAAEGMGLLVSVALSGPWTDRYGARRISVLADLAAAGAVAAIPASYFTVGLSLPALAVLSFGIGTGRAPARNAKQVLLPDAMAVSRTRTERATSAQEGTMSIGTMLGAPLGGSLIALFGPPGVLFVDAGMLLGSVTLVGLLVHSNLGATDDTAVQGGGVRRYFSELSAGLRWLRKDRLLFAIGALAAVVNALLAGMSGVLLPAYGTRVWHSSTQVGLVVAAIGTGGVLGTMLYAWIGDRISRWAVCAGSILFFAGPMYVTLAIDPPAWLLVLLVLLFAIAFGPLNPVIAAVRYDRVPVELRGRVFGALTGGALAITPLGPVLAGLLLDAIGLTTTTFVLAAITLVITVSPFIFPVWREMDAQPQTSAESDPATTGAAGT